MCRPAFLSIIPFSSLSKHIQVESAPVHKMAAMLAMTATVVSTHADIFRCSFLCPNALRL